MISKLVENSWRAGCLETCTSGSAGDSPETCHSNMIGAGILPYYLAKLERVVDGGTLLINFDLGFFATLKSKVRLIGI